MKKIISVLLLLSTGMYAQQATPGETPSTPTESTSSGLQGLEKYMVGHDVFNNDSTKNPLILNLNVGNVIKRVLAIVDSPAHAETKAALLTFKTEAFSTLIKLYDQLQNVMTQVYKELELEKLHFNEKVHDAQKGLHKELHTLIQTINQNPTEPFNQTEKQALKETAKNALEHIHVLTKAALDHMHEITTPASSGTLPILTPATPHEIQSHTTTTTPEIHNNHSLVVTHK